MLVSQVPLLINVERVICHLRNCHYRFFKCGFVLCWRLLQIRWIKWVSTFMMAGVSEIKLIAGLIRWRLLSLLKNQHLRLWIIIRHHWLLIIMMFEVFVSSSLSIGLFLACLCNLRLEHWKCLDRWLTHCPLPFRLLFFFQQGILQIRIRDKVFQVIRGQHSIVGQVVLIPGEIWLSPFNESETLVICVQMHLELGRHLSHI